MRTRWLNGLLMLWLSAAIVPVQAAISASIDRTRIGAGDTVQLTLKYDGITSSEPDLRPLQRNFTILGSSTSTSVQIGTGGSAESTEVALTLSPKRSGQLTIPSLSWDGERSSPLSLTVLGPGAPSGAPAAASTPAGRIFIETSVTPTHPYVQAAVQVAVRIYASEQLYHGTLAFSGNSAALVKKIGADTYGNTVRDGRTYQVITRRYLLFPLHRGTLTLPGPQLEADVPARTSSSWSPFGNFFGGLVQSTRPIRVSGSPITLAVRPRPAGAAGSYWLPAENLTLTAAWQSGRRARAGEPVTVALDLQAVGLTAAQLPALTPLLHLPPGLKVYPDQARLDNTVQGNMIVGSRDQTLALIADRPGRYSLAGLKVRWWDTLDNQPRSAILPARTLTILPAAAGITASTPPAPAAQMPQTIGRHSPPPVPAAVSSAAKAQTAGAPFPWQWVSGGFAALWLATLGAWRWSRGSRRSHEPRARAASVRDPSLPDASKDRAAFRSACANDDALAARRHLLAWAEAAWGSAPTGLNALAAALGDPTTANLLRELDRACYGGSDWRGQPLSLALRELPSQTTGRSRNRPGLAPLYP